MTDTPAIYLMLCKSDDPAAELARMQDASLAALAADLLAAGIHSGFPGLMLELCQAEGMRRWVEDHAPVPGAVGEG